MKAQESDRTERKGVGIAMTAFESIDFAFRQQSESDYGIDAHSELIIEESPTGRLLGIQLKSGNGELKGDILVFDAVITQQQPTPKSGWIRI